MHTFHAVVEAAAHMIFGESWVELAAYQCHLSRLVLNLDRALNDALALSFGNASSSQCLSRCFALKQQGQWSSSTLVREGVGCLQIWCRNSPSQNQTKKKWPFQTETFSVVGGWKSCLTYELCKLFPEKINVPSPIFRCHGQEEKMQWHRMVEAIIWDKSPQLGLARPKWSDKNPGWPLTFEVISLMDCHLSQRPRILHLLIFMLFISAHMTAKI